MNIDYLLKMKNENDYNVAYLKEINNNYAKMKEETIIYSYVALKKKKKKALNTENGLLLISSASA